ncbi:MAG: DUF4185 domain-containing protein, partial [Gemmatimonadota bacterium]
MVTSITFDFSTHDRRAPGSDNWPVTWADDDHQYTTWGDGGGFGGTNDDSRVSLGVARVTGGPEEYTGENVWGGKNADNEARFGGKSYGIVSIDGVLYMWVSPSSGRNNFKRAALYRSADRGRSWTPAGWRFDGSEGLILPTFLQYGRDYAGARDGFVYVYAVHLQDPSGLVIQRPGEIALLRVPRDQLMERDAYEFFAGLDPIGQPSWTPELEGRAPVFEDANGVGWNVSVSYNGPLGRYFLITEHSESQRGNMGIFDAPEPWGPWTTVRYAGTFGEPGLDATETFFWNFSNKWLSASGQDAVLVFTGADA